MGKLLMVTIGAGLLAQWSTVAQRCTTQCTTQPVATVEFTSQIDRASYALGVQLARRFKTASVAALPRRFVDTWSAACWRINNRRAVRVRPTKSPLKLRRGIRARFPMNSLNNTFANSN